MLTCFSFAEKARANPKNKSGMAMSGRIVPKILKPELNSPIPNILKRLPIAESAKSAETQIPTAVPTVTTIKKRSAKEIRNLPEDFLCTTIFDSRHRRNGGRDLCFCDFCRFCDRKSFQNVRDRRIQLRLQRARNDPSACRHSAFILWVCPCFFC